MRVFSLIALLFTVLVLLPGCSSEQHEQQSDSPQSEPATETRDARGFDELQSEYYDTEIRVIWQKPKLIIDLIEDVASKTIADLGAGTGYFAFRLASEGARVIAIDIDPRAIEFMESEKARYPEDVQARFSTRLAQPDNAALADKEVDAVLLVNTYIYIEDRVPYFTQLRQGLKPGGKVIIVDFKAKETEIGPDQEDRLPLNQVQLELTQSGYAIESADTEMLEYQYVITARVPEN